MTIDLDSFPIVPESRSALTSAGIRQYITSPAWSNFQKLETLLETIETQFNALPVTYRQASLPDVGNLLDRWIDTSSGEQEKICTSAYLSGDGVAGDWTSMRDTATLALATTAAADAAATRASSASDFPTAYTVDWLFVNSTTGATYICIETYEVTFTGDRSTKFIAVTDAVNTTAVGNLQASIDNMADDNIISSIEKRTLQREWNQIQSNKSLVDSLATALGQTSSSEYVTAVATYDALDLYLNTTLDLFNDLNSDTSLSTLLTTRTEWNNKWQQWYVDSAAFQNFISTSLDADINAGQNDENITLSEKRDYEIRWNYEVQNYSQHDTVTDTLDSSPGVNYTKVTDPVWLAYFNAYNDLNSYLNTQLDLFNQIDANFPFALSSASPASSATEWTSKWDGYTTAERAVSELTNNTLATQIDSLADDGTISAGGEKNLAINAWRAIYGDTGTEGEYGLLLSRANTLNTDGSLASAISSMTSAYNALNTYLNTTITDFLVATEDTSVDNTTWDSTWNLYYRKYAELDKDTSSIADTNVGLISAFADDQQITTGIEKQNLIELYSQIVIEKNKMVARAAIGVGADTTAFVAAFDALDSYLKTVVFASEAAFLDNSTSASGINRSIWKTTFDAYYTAREDLETAILSNNISTLTTSSATIPNMATDGDITPEEKTIAQTYWNVIYGTADDGEHAALAAQATSLGVGASYLTNYASSYHQLWNYLFNDDSGETPLSEVTPIQVFASMGTTTSLTSSQQEKWQEYWSAYYAQRDTITTQIQTALNTNLNAKLDVVGGVLGSNLDAGTFNIFNMAQAAGSGQAVEYTQLTDHEADTSTHGVTTVAGLAETQTFTNKTLTLPVLASFYQNAAKTLLVTVPNATTVLVGRDTTDTLTNKTYDAEGTGNVLSNIQVTNFKAGVVRTTIRVDPDAEDDKLATEQAVREELDTVVATAVAAATAAAGEDFNCRASDKAGVAGTTFDGPLVGTGIDTLGANYLNSGFTLSFEGLIGNYASSPDELQTYFANLRGVLSKKAGSTTVSCEIQNVLSGELGGVRTAVAQWEYGTLNTDNDKLGVDIDTSGIDFTDVGIERVDHTANELTFRLYAVANSSVANWASTLRISGPRILTDTEVGPTGTTF